MERERERERDEREGWGSTSTRESRVSGLLENLTGSKVKKWEEKRVNKKTGDPKEWVRGTSNGERELGIGNYGKWQKNYGATVGDGLASVGNRDFWVQKHWGEDNLDYLDRERETARQIDRHDPIWSRISDLEDYEWTLDQCDFSRADSVDCEIMR